MASRKVIAGVLMILMSSPTWGAAEAVGSVTASNAGMVKNAKLTPGSTLFSGDTISVGEHGAVEIALPKGAQAEVLGGSLVRLMKSADKTRMAVDSGQASFQASSNSDVEALIADASVRPADGTVARAVIQSLSSTHAIIAAQKGALLVTASNGMTYSVREGEAADLSVAADPAPQGGTTRTLNKKGVIWTVVIVSAGGAIAAYLLGRGEPDRSSTIGNEISPTKLN